jgi:hypothetical protein
MLTFFFPVYSLIRINDREKFGVCGWGKILSGDKSIEAQGWGILCMD